MVRSKTGFSVAVALAALAFAVFSQLAWAQEPGPQALARKIGSIKAINGNVLTLAPDSGSDIAVTVQPNARLLRIAPGEKDLKNATPVQPQDLQIGDRIRVRGQASADATSISALEIIVMARTDLDAHRQQEQQDWQKRGTGGLVKNVDPATGTVTVSVTGLGGTREIAIHTAKNTVFRRYAPDSVKFDDAKPSTLQEIHAGDQLRARGNRSADGSEVTADEVVTGSFRNVAGTVNSVDASAGILNVQDLVSKKNVTVKITPESQMHKMPPELAQMIAMRLKGSATPANGTPAGASPAATPPAGSAPAGMRPSQGSAPEARTGAPVATGPGAGMQGAAGHRSGSADFQQMLNRMPGLNLDDLHKGDAVLIVATQGTESSSTAITLLTGVEPILQAAPASQGTMLTPWSLGGAPGGDASQ